MLGRRGLSMRGATVEVGREKDSRGVRDAGWSTVGLQNDEKQCLFSLSVADRADHIPRCCQSDRSAPQ